MICQKGNEAQNTHSKLSPLIGVVGSFCFIFIYTGEIAFADEICTATASSKYYNECKQVQIKISQESLSLLKERSELIDSIKDYFGTKQEEAAIRNKNFIKNITACDADEVCLTGAFEAQLKFYESRLINKGIDVQAFMNQSVVIRESKSLLAEIKQAALIEAKKRDAAIALDRKIMADKANFDRKQAEEDRVQSEIATARSTVEYLKQAAE